VSDSRDDDVDELSRGSRNSSELLDLVRAAEDEARIPTRQAPPSSAAVIVEADELVADGDAETEGSDDVVDVGDEAVDAPPSRPGQAHGASEAATPGTVPPPAVSSGRASSPLVVIALLFALAGAALFLLAR
jgi:hypothetical protein